MRNRLITVSEEVSQTVTKANWHAETAPAHVRARVQAGSQTSPARKTGYKPAWRNSPPMRKNATQRCRRCCRCSSSPCRKSRQSSTNCSRCATSRSRRSTFRRRCARRRNQRCRLFRAHSLRAVTARLVPNAHRARFRSRACDARDGALVRCARSGEVRCSHSSRRSWQLPAPSYPPQPLQQPMGFPMPPQQGTVGAAVGSDGAAAVGPASRAAVGPAPGSFGVPSHAPGAVHLADLDPALTQPMGPGECPGVYAASAGTSGQADAERRAQVPASGAAEPDGAGDGGADRGDCHCRRSEAGCSGGRLPAERSRSALPSVILRRAKGRA